MSPKATKPKLTVVAPADAIASQVSDAMAAVKITDAATINAATEFAVAVVQSSARMLDAAVAGLKLRLTVKHEGKPDVYGQSPEWRVLQRATLAVAIPGDDDGAKDRRQSIGSTIRNHYPAAARELVRLGLLPKSFKWNPPSRGGRPQEALRKPTAEQVSAAATVLARADAAEGIKPSKSGATTTGSDMLKTAWNALRAANRLPLIATDADMAESAAREALIALLRINPDADTDAIAAAAAALAPEREERLTAATAVVAES